MAALSAADFDFELPDAQIAHKPTETREGSRLLLVESRGVSHHLFSSLPELIERHVGQGALLVLNDSKVLRARLFAKKRLSDGQLGGRVELLLLEPLGFEAQRPVWRAMFRVSKPLREHAELQLLRPDGSPFLEKTLTVQAVEGEGRARFVFPSDPPLDELLSEIGVLPLPPYIVQKREKLAGSERFSDDDTRYQTVYAKELGSVAAPTAGLHFSEKLLSELSDRGIESARVTLHVGPGTFLPLRDEDPDKHVMHAERYFVPEETCEAIARARREGRKVLAVGTTVVRTLESATRPGKNVPEAAVGETQLFIRPQPPTFRYPFAAVDALLTNFHLPRSTLLMLVAAFAGRERTLSAYREAVSSGYRFYSYGDAMLLPCRM